MKYKGFVILPSYTVGSDFKINKHNEVIDRKPTKKDIEYYVIYDPIENMNRWIAEFTVKECKHVIDNFLEAAKMKSNLQKEWDKL